MNMHKTARGLLLGLVALLLLFGVVMLYSTSYTVFDDRILRRQLIWVLIGSAGAVWLRCLDYRKIGKSANLLLLLVSCILLYLAIAASSRWIPGFPAGLRHSLPLIGAPIKGSFRWLRFWGFFSLQPSEFAKLAIIIFLANYFGNKNRRINQAWLGFFKPVGITMGITVLILAGKDFSTSVVTATTIFALTFIAGARLRYLILTVIICACLGGLLLSKSEVRMRRLRSFRNPEEVQQTDGYQLWTSQLAMGSGGWRGRGFTKSHMKQRYLPEAHTDFIVAIIGEELGFAFVLGVITVYFLLICSIFWIAALAPDREGTLLCSGIGLLIGLQAFINISVVSGFLPTTGVTAPLLSYGGSSIIASILGIGLLLSVNRISEIEQDIEILPQRIAPNTDKF